MAPRSSAPFAVSAAGCDRRPTRRGLTVITRHVTIGRLIRSFGCSLTEALARGRRVAQFVNIEGVARRKLRQLEIAGRLDDLRVPPGNRLEVLRGDRVGQHSIRVNEQFRICFRWTAGGPEDVEITDYH
jgi:toxin HigB-1